MKTCATAIMFIPAATSLFTTNNTLFATLDPHTFLGLMHLELPKTLGTLLGCVVFVDNENRKEATQVLLKPGVVTRLTALDVCEGTVTE